MFLFEKKTPYTHKKKGEGCRKLAEIVKNLGLGWGGGGEGAVTMCVSVSTPCIFSFLY